MALKSGSVRITNYVIESCDPNPFEYDYERRDCHSALVSLPANLINEEVKNVLQDILEDYRSLYADSNKKDQLTLIRSERLKSAKCPKTNQSLKFCWTPEEKQVIQDLIESFPFPT